MQEVTSKSLGSAEMRQAYFDVKVVSPFARSYSHLTQASIMKTAEKAKMREYKERIRDVEHADFNQLVFTMGAMAPQCQIVVKICGNWMAMCATELRSAATYEAPEERNLRSIELAVTKLESLNNLARMTLF